MTKEQLDEIERLAQKWTKFGVPKQGAESLAEHALPLVNALRKAHAEIERCKRSLAQQEDLVKHFEPRAYSACLLPPEGCQCAGCDYRREWERS